MNAALAAAFGYFLTVFAVGFGLGALRSLLLVPKTGAFAAVALEVPVMLAVSWLLAGWATRRWRVPSTAGARLAMGALALALLMGAELALAVWGFGQTVRGFLAALGRPEGMLGLAGQAAFGLMPLLRLARCR